MNERTPTPVLDNGLGGESPLAKLTDEAEEEHNRPMSRTEHIGLFLAIGGTVMFCFIVGLITTVSKVLSWF